MAKERPIIMYAPMMAALLENRKTQTRRIISRLSGIGNIAKFDISDTNGYEYHFRDKNMLWNDVSSNFVLDKCPYGKIGDRLWVREAWQFADWTEDGDPYIRYKSDGKVSIKRHVPDDWVDKVSEIFTVLSRPSNYSIDEKASDRRWRSPFYMPRWASRINLEITNIGVERLQDISEQDAIAEGAEAILVPPDGGSRPYYEGYRDLWESINGKGSFDSNPFVWKIQFRRI